MAENLLHFTDGTFETEVINSPLPVLVDFWAPWCGPCLKLAPTIEELAEEYAGKVKIGKLDTDSNQSAAMKYGITSIPTVIIFQNGEVVRTFVGLTSKKEIKAALDEVA